MDIAVFDWCHEKSLSEPRVTVLTRRDALPIRKYINSFHGTTELFDYPDGDFDRLIHLAAPSALIHLEVWVIRLSCNSFTRVRKYPRICLFKVTGRCLFTIRELYMVGFQWPRMGRLTS